MTVRLGGADIQGGMSESQLQEAVIDCAHTFRWMVAHFRPARVMRGGREIYETPVAADGKGFPDLVLVRRGRLVFAELKTASGKPSAHQDVWLRELFAVERESATVQTFVWRPEHWLSGEIEDVLR